MSEIITVGHNLEKDVFQAHRDDGAGRAVGVPPLCGPSQSLM